MQTDLCLLKLISTPIIITHSKFPTCLPFISIITLEVFKFTYIPKIQGLPLSSSKCLPSLGESMQLRVLWIIWHFKSGEANTLINSFSDRIQIIFTHMLFNHHIFTLLFTRSSSSSIFPSISLISLKDRMSMLSTKI